jgi:phosphoglycolate phosphatase-like HAD superfamily hydrolase
LTRSLATAVVFDLDGTLVSLPVDIAAVRQQLSRRFDALGYSGGFSPVLAGIDEAAQRVGETAAERARLRRLAREIIDRAEVLAAASAKVCSGARELVSALHQAGIPLGLVTNNGRACVPACLAALGARGWFADRAIVTRDDAACKPSPAGILAAAGALLPGRGRVVFVGDSDADVKAALAAGAGPFEVVMVRVGRGSGVGDLGSVTDEVLALVGDR